MKPIRFLLMSLLLCSLQLAGQTTESKVRELLDLQSYENDKEAGALIVYDYGVSDFFQGESGFYTKFTRKFRVKFFNDSNLDYSEISIPVYFGERKVEEIEDFKAVVYNLKNGVIEQVRTDKNELLKEKHLKNWYNYKVAVAGVKAGSVMDVEYTVVSPFIYQLNDWQFQYTIPVLYSEYLVYMIPFYLYSYIIKGTSQLDELSSELQRDKYPILNLEYQKTRYKFVKKNIPAFYGDEFITSPNDYLISLDFQLAEINHLEGYNEKITTTWPKFTEELIKETSDFGGYIRGSKKLAKETLKENQFVYSTKLDYLEKLVDYVKANYDWNQYSSCLADVKPAEFARTKKGNVTAINLFLVTLLREAGFTAEPVILSTRNNGKIYTKYPFAHYFNYTIAVVNVDGTNYLIDASEKHSYFDQIPQRAINEIGLVVAKGEENWVNLTSNNFSTDLNTFYYKLNNETDSFSCTYNCKEAGYFALNSKNEYKDDPEKFIKDNITPLFDEVYNSNVMVNDTLRFFRYTAAGSVIPTRIDKYISIKPFLNTVYASSPFKMKERAYPVDFIYARKRMFSAQILLPEGATLVKLPENFEMENEFFGLKYNAALRGNAVVVEAEYSLKKPVYAPSLYPGLRNFFDNMIKYFNQSVEFELK